MFRHARVAAMIVVALIAVFFVADAMAAHSLSTLWSGNGPEIIFAAAAAASPMDTLHSEIKRINGETVGAIQDMRADLRAAQQLIDKIQTGGGYAAHSGGPSIGARLTRDIEEQPGFQALKNWNPGGFRMKADIGIHAALTNESSGTSSDSQTIPGQSERGPMRGPVLRSLRLIDALPSRPTSRDSVDFIQVSVEGDAEEQILEGDEKAELDFSGELKNAHIATIAGHTTASKQVLSDAPALQGVIDRVIRHKVLSRLENQLINGPGGQGKIAGLINQSTILVPSIGVEPADVIGEAVTRLADNGYSPGLVIMSPLDWFRIQLTKTATEENYKFGSPITPQAPGLWNTRFVLTPSLAEGKCLILDPAFVTVLDREQVSVVASNTHKDYFTRNLVAILGELRAGLEVADLNAVYQVDIDFAPLSS